VSYLGAWRVWFECHGIGCVSVGPPLVDGCSVIVPGELVLRKGMGMTMQETAIVCHDSAILNLDEVAAMGTNVNNSSINVTHLCL